MTRHGIVTRRWRKGVTSKPICRSCLALPAAAEGLCVLCWTAPAPEPPATSLLRWSPRTGYAAPPGSIAGELLRARVIRPVDYLR